MILFAIKKRIFAKYQPLNLCSLTKPSPSPGAPQISAQQESTPPRVSPASPSTAGKAKPQQQHDTPSAPEREKKPQQERKHPAPRRPARKRRPQPSDQEPPSRPRPAVPISQPPTVSKEQQPRHRPAETDGERDGEREGKRSDRITHSFSAVAHRRRTPARQERPTPSRRLESLTSAAVPDSRQDSQRRRRFNSAFGEKTEPRPLFTPNLYGRTPAAPPAMAHH